MCSSDRLAVRGGSMIEGRCLLDELEDEGMDDW